jgi:predicted NAD-dependent protein-ADP-ribosyltransferase YbiA (DUF1768 family)
MVDMGNYAKISDLIEDHICHSFSQHYILAENAPLYQSFFLTMDKSAKEFIMSASNPRGAKFIGSHKKTIHNGISALFDTRIAAPRFS